MIRRSQSQILRTRIGLGMSPLFGSYERIKQHTALAELYPEYLILLHMIIRASMSLLSSAAERARNIDDQLSDALSTYFAAHMLEEEGHDEWVLDDLKVLGIDAAAVLARMPPWPVAAMVGSQYYWINHHHPVALLGYIAVLEGYPAKPEDIDAMIERTGLPAAAFRTWEKHAALDPGHTRELDELLNSLLLGPHELSCVSISGLTTVRFAAAAFDQLFEEAAVTPA